jgi:DNA-binding NtrC family response regulator
MLLRLLVSGDETFCNRVLSLVSDEELRAQTADHPVHLAAAEPVDIIVVADTDHVLREVVEPVRALPDPADVIIIADQRRAEAEAALLAGGALGVLYAGLPDEELSAALAALLERTRVERRAQTEVELAEDVGEDFVYRSEAMRQTVGLAKRIAGSTTTCLVLGETGVGKERVARYIHDHSQRSDGPFIALNCAAIPDGLVESELFGHAKGSFTGASDSRRGYFELAHGGTLFLDEVGELPAGTQAKLLRALQDHEIRPIGADETVTVDVRLVAATNRDLEVEMAEGRFRRDLYYRLGVVELRIPALRERPDDVKRLLEVYRINYAAQMGSAVSGYTPEALAALMQYDWPGNVRELINVVERAVLLCLRPQIELADLPLAISAPQKRPAVEPLLEGSPEQEGSGVSLPEAWLQRPWKEVRKDLLREGERAYLSNILAATGGRVGLAARHAGLAERSLFDKMKTHGLRKEDFRSVREPGPDSEA